MEEVYWSALAIWLIIFGLFTTGLVLFEMRWMKNTIGKILSSIVAISVLMFTIFIGYMQFLI